MISLRRKSTGKNYLAMDKSNPRATAATAGRR
jgi:hypothetical protein